MARDRKLDWEDARNVRDLGGLPTADGRRTRFGALVRADALDRLTATGWRTVEAHGVGTVIDLRNDDEVRPDVTPRPRSVETLHLPLDAMEDRDFWDDWDSGPQFGTPLYYGPHLECFPERTAAVVSAIARAAPGGVAFHCGVGRDRAGLVAVAVMALVGVTPDAIAADYELSAGNLADDEGTPVIAAFLEARGTSAGDLVRELVTTVDIEAVVRRGGTTETELRALRARLLEP